MTGKAVTGESARLTPRPDKGLRFDEAIDEVLRDYDGVLAALAESERRDREAETGPANIARGLTR